MKRAPGSCPPTTAISGIPRSCLLPDTTRPVVDLFAAETGGLLALVHYLLGQSWNLPPRHLSAAVPGGGGPGAAALAQPALLVDGRRSRTHVQLDQLVYPEPAAGHLLLPTTQTQRRSAVQQAAYSLDCFEGLRPRWVLQ